VVCFSPDYCRYIYLRGRHRWLARHALSFILQFTARRSHKHKSLARIAQECIPHALQHSPVARYVPKHTNETVRTRENRNLQGIRGGILHVLRLYNRTSAFETGFSDGDVAGKGPPIPSPAAREACNVLSSAPGGQGRDSRYNSSSDAVTLSAIRRLRSARSPFCSSAFEDVLPLEHSVEV
jgi:hypothetical protein